jgi:hypothetical protein
MVSQAAESGRFGKAPGKRGVMADLGYYAAKIAECLRLLESSSDPLYRNVYQAMADEFAAKHAALLRRGGIEPPNYVPPSALLHSIAPTVASPQRERGSRRRAKTASGERPAGRKRSADSDTEGTSTGGGFASALPLL